MSALSGTAWFAEWFDHDYLKIYGHRDARDAEPGVDLLCRTVKPAPGSAVLDLGCGPGRHAVLLGARGLTVVGLDLSMVLLGAARAAGCATVALALVRGDMRSLPFTSGSFALVTSFFTSFGYFDDAGNDAVLAEVHRVLRPGGHFFLDFLNHDNVLAHLAPEASRRLGSTYVIEAREYDAAAGRLNKRIEIQDGSETRIRNESVRLYRPEEVSAALRCRGLEPEATFGDLTGGQFDPAHSPRLVIIARRS